jgi:hypothetical protein
MKVVINDEYGGYHLSTEILKMYLERTNTPYTTSYQSGAYYSYDCIVVDDNPFTEDCISRRDPILIEILEEIGYVNKGLKIVTIPDFAKYSIGEYDGKEWIENTWINVTVDELAFGLSQERLEQASQVDFIKVGVFSAEELELYFK